MAAATVPKLYRSVIDDVLNSVREVFLDDGVDEQVLHELKLTWEKKLSESKAVDNNAREPEPTAVTKQSSRANNSSASHSSRNSHNRDHTQHTTQHAQQQQQQQQHHHQQQQQHQHQQQPQTQTHHVSALHQHESIVHPNNHNQIAVNHISGASGGPTNMSPHLQIQPNIVLGPSGVNYTTSETADGQKNVMSSLPQKLVLVQGIGGQSQPYVLTSPSGTLNISPELLNQIALQQGNILTHTQTQPTVVHHASNVSLPQNTIQYAPTLRQPQTAAPRPPQSNRVVQLDGAHDTSDEDDDDEEYREQEEDNDDNDDDVNDDDNEGQGEDEEPLNSEDDVSDEDPTELFDTDNVVVCQYDKITRSRNKWKFHLKDGIMNLQGKDYVFQKAVGDAEW